MLQVKLIPYFIAIPLAAAFITALLHRWVRDAGRYVTPLAAAGLLALVLQFIPAPGITVYRAGNWVPVYGITLAVDGLSALLLLLVAIVTLAVSVFSWRYLEHYTDHWKYYTLLLLMVTGMNGVLITGDLFTLYVFLEIASVASYALVAFGTGDEELEAAFKYMVLGSLASVMILLGIALAYRLTGALSFSGVSQGLAGLRGGYLPGFLTALFIAGFGLKAAMVPFHAWLPDAHTSAPAPISATLSGILIKVLGVYTLTRVLFNVVGMGPAVARLLLAMGTVTMIVGGFLAIRQWDFKRLLAYSSVSQIGYILIGLGLATPIGVMGALFHLFNHALFKSLLFLNAGAVEYATGTRRLDQLGGLREKMPITANTSLIASMSISGVPPFNGFWSKLIIIVACVEAGRVWLALAAALMSIVTLAYFLKVQRYGFWGGLKDTWSGLREAPWPMTAAMVFLAILCVLSALLVLPAVNNEILGPAVRVVLYGTRYLSGDGGAIAP